MCSSRHQVTAHTDRKYIFNCTQMPRRYQGDTWVAVLIFRAVKNLEYQRQTQQSIIDGLPSVSPS